jgi:D-3-phosphoglycerate dehydrogenase / 2-oxoglutarate reductase
MTHTTGPAHDPVDALVLDLLDWIGTDGRPYAEVMEAWRTSCPRLPVWEEANLRGLVDQGAQPAGGSRVSLSAAGRRCLLDHHSTR